MLFTPIKPMLASSWTSPFDDANYIFEPKWDGSRILLHKQGSRIEAYTRNGSKVTSQFPEIGLVGAGIKLHSAILDCEGIVIRGGQACFDDVSYRLRLSQSMKIKQAAGTHPVTFVAFDLLYSDRPHVDEPLVTRKARLMDAIETTPVLMPTMYVEDQGQAMFDVTREQGMEGMIAKRKDTAYVQGVRSADWLKMKHARTIDVMILGYKLNPFELVIGLNFRTVKHKPVGFVRDGFTEHDQAVFVKLAQKLSTRMDQQTYWMEPPQLCCRITYLDRSDTHQLGSTVFVQFLPEKDPETCIWPSSGT
ncbi:ATP-dependent DNA ligase [Paenibacillus aestuarii]|uniref:DNA ligase n=1 Tax=Paenibacillus aestuarii TaxID=516965 RepID=A0ABW0KHK9_9BACL|nr:DNA ligase [Paenibacillus aestuarii]